MSRYRRKAMYWPIGLLILAVGMCGRARNQSSSSDHVHAPERTLAQRSSVPVSTPHKLEDVAEQGLARIGHRHQFARCGTKKTTGSC